MTSRPVRLGSAVLMVLALSMPARAHTKLEKSQPAAGAVLTAAPPSVELWFNEIPDVKVSKIEIKGPAGKVDLGPAHAMSAKSLMAGVAGKMADGKYTVSWQTAGDDGHVLKGEFSFTVKASK